MDITSRLRAIVRSGPQKPAGRELTYEPDVGRYESTLDLDRVSEMLGGIVVSNGIRPLSGCRSAVRVRSLAW